MTVTTDIENKKMTAVIDGRLDTLTSPELESKLKDIPAGIRTKSRPERYRICIISRS